MTPDILAVADYLRDRIALYGEHSRAPGSERGHLVDGKPFWIAVAEAAVAMGARAEKLPMHGPVRNLGGG